jgi:hypothetical protein
MSLYALDCPPDAQGYGENYESLFVDTHEMRGGGMLASLEEGAALHAIG